MWYSAGISSKGYDSLRRESAWRTARRGGGTARSISSSIFGREEDTLLGQGKAVAQAGNMLDVIAVAYYRWRRQYGGATRDLARKPRALKKENRGFKQAVAE